MQLPEKPTKFTTPTTAEEEKKLNTLQDVISCTCTELQNAVLSELKEVQKNSSLEDVLATSKRFDKIKEVSLKNNLWRYVEYSK